MGDVKGAMSFGLEGARILGTLRYSRELEEMKAVLAHTDEKYEGLREEYRDARHVFEEKLTQALRENEEWKVKVNQLGEEIQTHQKDKQTLREAVGEVSHKYEKIKTDYEGIRQQADQEMNHVLKSVQEGAQKGQEMAAKIEGLEHAQAHLEQAAFGRSSRTVFQPP